MKKFACYIVVALILFWKCDIARADIRMEFREDPDGNVYGKAIGSLILSGSPVSISQNTGGSFAGDFDGNGSSLVLLGGGDGIPGEIYQENNWTGQTIGTGSLRIGADSSSKSPIGFEWVPGDQPQMFLAVPFRYHSGNTFSGASIWNNKTLADLGLTPGTYVFTSASNTITVDVVGTSEPASVALVAAGIPCMMLVRRLRRQKTAALLG